MKYYVVSDVHGFYTIAKNTLQQCGFFDDVEPHKVILCGDMMDRGTESVETQLFFNELLHKEELIFIRGNHEDMFLDMIDNFEKYRWGISLGTSHHYHNRTWHTALNLANTEETFALRHTDEFISKIRETPFYKELIPSSINYYETENYIFVHGWIPCFSDDLPSYYYKFNPDWRNATNKAWETARWSNGMALAELHNIVEHGKQIVCGHWHTSYGHHYLEKRGSEFEDDADFTPFYGKNIIAIDGCTAISKKINCIVLND